MGHMIWHGSLPCYITGNRFGAIHSLVAGNRVSDSIGCTLALRRRHTHLPISNAITNDSGENFRERVRARASITAIALCD